MGRAPDWVRLHQGLDREARARPEEWGLVRVGRQFRARSAVAVKLQVRASSRSQEPNSRRSISPRVGGYVRRSVRRSGSGASERTLSGSDLWSLTCWFAWSPRQESNLRPAVYKTAALPAELLGQVVRTGWLLGCSLGPFYGWNASARLGSSTRTLTGSPST